MEAEPPRTDERVVERAVAVRAREPDRRARRDRRPGSALARTASFAFYARTRRCDPEIDWRRAASLAGTGTSPAALRQALDDALALALADEGPDAVVRWSHVAAAILRDGRIDDARELAAAERWAIAVHEAGHAIVGSLLVERPTALSLRREGGVTEAEEDDRASFRDLPDSHVRGLMAITFGGMAADRLVLGEARVGGARDVAQATNLALRRIAHGMDGSARPLDFDRFDQTEAALTERFAAVAAAVTEARTEAERVVSAHGAAIEHVARALAEAGHLSGTDLVRVLDEALGCHPLPGRTGSRTGRGLINRATLNGRSDRRPAAAPRRRRDTRAAPAPSARRSVPAARTRGA